MNPSTRHCMLVQWSGWVFGVTALCVIVGLPVWLPVLAVTGFYHGAEATMTLVGACGVLWLIGAGATLVCFTVAANNEPSIFSEPDYSNAKLRRRVVARRTLALWLSLLTLALCIFLMLPDQASALTIVLLIVFALGAGIPALVIARRSLRWTTARQAERLARRVD